MTPGHLPSIPIRIIGLRQLCCLEIFYSLSSPLHKNYTWNKLKHATFVIKKIIYHPCPQQTFRFIKNGHLQFFVFQKVWYIGVTKSIKLKKFLSDFYFMDIGSLWRHRGEKRPKNSWKLRNYWMKQFEKGENLLNFVFRWF